MLRTPSVIRNSTSATASALVSKNLPAPLAFTVQGQAIFAFFPVCQRPDSAFEMACSRCNGIAFKRSADLTAVTHIFHLFAVSWVVLARTSTVSRTSVNPTQTHNIKRSCILYPPVSRDKRCKLGANSGEHRWKSGMTVWWLRIAGAECLLHENLIQPTAALVAACGNDPDHLKPGAFVQLD